jgi:signal transduction histidine kinase/CheY-like chemotaxis protein
MEAAFAHAEEIVSRFFAGWRAEPERGAIEIFGERYVLVRAASLSVEFFALVRELYGAGREGDADRFSRNLLFDLAHAIGKSDAQNFHAKMQLDDPISRLSAGPVHFAHTGWASVEIHPESVTTPDERFCLIYDHPSSFESDAWERAGERREFPVCIMNAGYSSGWCEESFGVELVASEVLCRARGDDHCRFVMAHPRRIEELVSRYIDSLPGDHARRGAHEIPDFFARKRAEEELRRSHAELEERVERRTAELRRSYDRLQQEIGERERVERELRHAHKLEAIGRLAGGIAHDFNNLMGAVTLRVARLKTRLRDDPASREDIEEIEEATGRATALTRQLLTFSRGRVTGIEAVDVSAAVSGLARTLLPLLGEDVILELDLADADVVVEAVRTQIDQVVMNLAMNAREAMPSGGRLTIATGRVTLGEPRVGVAGDIPPGDYALVEVADTGIGMNPELVTRIFDPFFTTKEHSHGTGLGLSTVYGVVQRCGGHIQVDTRPGHGTRFSLYMPASARRPAVASAPDDEAAVVGGPETVLLVEDQHRLRSSVTETLRELGYTVLATGTPAEALAIVERSGDRIELLLTDVVMPGMDGRELAARLRELKPATGVLFMSGYVPSTLGRSVTDDLQRAGLLQKPFTAEELARAVRRALDQRAKPAAD